MAKKIEVTPFALTVTPLTLYRGKCRVGDATGFFYLQEEHLFLITNKHVVIDGNKEHYPDTIKFRVHIDEKDLSKNKDVELSLYDKEGKPRWIEYKSNEVDIIAIGIDVVESKQWVIVKFNKNNFPPEDIILDIGEGLLVLGYPLGFYDVLYNLPITRNATIASNYPVPFMGKPYFLADANLHPGTSGSPVITKPTSITRSREKGTVMGKCASYIVGINSGSYNPLGLNIVWYIDLIEKIIKSR